ncbi:MAG TPA: K(+)-transporting ATPase subunit C [Candidatus Methylacidiphilales bacterium]|nr:K(+)-transporting ATPase subunit C [Candidatus Methylacidiphilales bacterium]
MNILHEIKTSVIVTLVMLVVCCFLYPLVIFGVGQALFPRQANGSLVMGADGKPIASILLGQTFSAAKYFNPRPSAAGTGYDSTSSGGSNYGATSQALHDAVQQRIADYRKANNLPDTQPLPADAVEASGSGLDPHISVKNALLQLPRVAKARDMSEDDLKKLVDQYTDGRDFGVLGDPGVNIIKLNLALDGKYK